MSWTDGDHGHCIKFTQQIQSLCCNSLTSCPRNNPQRNPALSIQIQVAFHQHGYGFWENHVETPDFELIQSTSDYEIRKYAPSVVAEVTYEPSQFKGNRDGDFSVLANYIGVLGNPQNTKPEKIAMTAPVITKSEKIAIPAPCADTGWWR